MLSPIHLIIQGLVEKKPRGNQVFHWTEEKAKVSLEHEP